MRLKLASDDEKLAALCTFNEAHVPIELNGAQLPDSINDDSNLRNIPLMTLPFEFVPLECVVGHVFDFTLHDNLRRRYRLKVYLKSRSISVVQQGDERPYIRMFEGHVSHHNQHLAACLDPTCNGCNDGDDGATFSTSDNQSDCTIKYDDKLNMDPLVGADGASNSNGMSGASDNGTTVSTSMPGTSADGVNLTCGVRVSADGASNYTADNASDCTMYYDDQLNLDQVLFDTYDKNGPSDGVVFDAYDYNGPSEGVNYRLLVSVPKSY
jgi:hypothetical protein